jgi:DNA-directed RNA polymerase specialized sigma24 family protein
MTENNDFNFESAVNEMENRRAEIIEKFDLKYGWSLERIAKRIQVLLKSKYRITNETAEDAAYEAVSKLLIYIFERKDLKFENESELFKFMYTIAIRKAFELIMRRAKFNYIENYEKYEDIVDASNNADYEEHSIETLLKEIYDGNKNIDAYLKEEIETLKLMELQVIEKLSYKEIAALDEYSNLNEATLRKKVERGLQKYRKFLKE